MNSPSWYSLVWFLMTSKQGFGIGIKNNRKHTGPVFVESWTTKIESELATFVWQVTWTRALSTTVSAGARHVSPDAQDARLEARPCYLVVKCWVFLWIPWVNVLKQYKGWKACTVCRLVSEAVNLLAKQTNDRPSSPVALETNNESSTQQRD